jgi:hypothetical protein
MSNENINKFKLIGIDIKNGITFTTMIDDKKIIKKHFEIKSIETIFGGNK